MARPEPRVVRNGLMLGHDINYCDVVLGVDPSAVHGDARGSEVQPGDREQDNARHKISIAKQRKAPARRACMKQLVRPVVEVGMAWLLSKQVCSLNGAVIDVTNQTHPGMLPKAIVRTTAASGSF